MWEDPIVAEVHRNREQLMARFNYDVKAFLADLRKRQAELGDKLVTPGKRGEPSVTAEANPPVGSPEATSTKATPAA